MSYLDDLPSDITNIIDHMVHKAKTKDLIEEFYRRTLGILWELNIYEGKDLCTLNTERCPRYLPEDLKPYGYVYASYSRYGERAHNWYLSELIHHGDECNQSCYKKRKYEHLMQLMDGEEKDCAKCIYKILRNKYLRK